LFWRNNKLEFLRFSILFFALLSGAAFFIIISEAAERTPAVSAAASYDGFGYPWEHNSLGLSNEVPSPWTEIQIVGNTLKCWGREYDLDNGMLPRQITSKGQALFHEPPGVSLKINRQNAIRGAGEAVFLLKTAKRVEYKTTWDEKEFRVEAVSSLEYDGLFRIDLSVYPQSRISVDELILTFPFRIDVALAFSRYIAYNYDYEKVDREDVVNSVGLADKPVTFKFNPAVWIGNHAVGLEWICETNAGWSNPDPESAIRIALEKDSVVMRIAVISKPTIISSPFTLSFALYPTPIKRLPDNWRNYFVLPAMLRRGDLNTDRYNLLGIGFGFPTKYPGLPILEPSENTKLISSGKAPEDQIRNELNRMQAEDVGFLPYGAFYGMPGRLPGHIWNDYGDTWRAMHPKGEIRSPWWAKLQNISGKEPSLISICPYHPSFQDFILWQYVQAIKKHQISGLYLDLSTPVFLCRNPNHPHGRFYLQGVEYYPFFTQREIMKRLYIACKSLKDDFVITQHQEKNLVICSGFSDIVLSGEALNRFFITSHSLSKLLNNDIFNENPSAYVPDYSRLSDDFFEFQYSQSKGYIHTILPQVVKWNDMLMRKNPDLLTKYSETLFARAVLYGIPLYFSRIDRNRYSEVLKAEQRVGGLAGAIYLGPWESNKFLMGGSGKLKASCYLLKERKRILLILANLSDHRVKETLSLNLEGLKSVGGMLGRNLQVMDGIVSKPFPADQGRLPVALDPNGFHMLTVQ